MFPINFYHHHKALVYINQNKKIHTFSVVANTLIKMLIKFKALKRF